MKTTRRQKRTHAVLAASLAALACLGLSAAPAAALDGLWVGTISVTAVSEVHADIYGTPPSGSLPGTSAPLDVQVILHGDADGSVLLLKEAYQVFRPAVVVDGVEQEPGRSVLLVDDTLIPCYEGTGLRDGVPVGRRVSAVTYDFPGQSVSCSGAIAPGATAGCSFTLGASDPTNPYRHVFHPDHAEGFAIGRALTFEFHDAYAGDDPDREPPGWGESVITGDYAETITGLFKEPLQVGGAFTLERVLPIDTITANCPAGGAAE